MTEDWVQRAADELSQLVYRHGMLTPQAAIEILRQHCPFAEGVTYVPVQDDAERTRREIALRIRVQEFELALANIRVENCTSKQLKIGDAVTFTEHRKPRFVEWLLGAMVVPVYRETRTAVAKVSEGGWTQTTASPEIKADVSKMLQLLEQDKAYGPWPMYLPDETIVTMGGDPSEWPEVAEHPGVRIVRAHTYVHTCECGHQWRTLGLSWVPCPKCQSQETLVEL